MADTASLATMADPASIDWFLTHVDIRQTLEAMEHTTPCQRGYLAFRTPDTSTASLSATHVEQLCTYMNKMCELIAANKLQETVCPRCDNIWYTSHMETTTICCEDCR